jgi:hypothetical protein
MKEILAKIKIDESFALLSLEILKNKNLSF